MKIRLLPDTDLARIAPLPTDEKLKALEKHKSGPVLLTYNPFRKSISDILNLSVGFLTSMESVSIEMIEKTIGASARHDDECNANLEVARGLRAFVEDESIIGRQHAFSKLAIGNGHKLTLCQSAILSYRQRPLIILVDPRRNNGLNREARRFAFSLMNEHIRMADPDFSDVRFGIVRFARESVEQDGKSMRPATLYPDDHVSYYSYSELEAMIEETYAIWNEVLLGRIDSARRFGGAF